MQGGVKCRHRSAPQKSGKVADTRRGGGQGAGGREWPGDLGVCSQPARPGSAQPSRPHSPEARAGSPRAAAPPDLWRRRRRLQQPRQGRIMRPRSRQARCRPHGSARVVPAGPIGGEVAAKHTREPRAWRAVGATPEVNPARSAEPRLRSSRRPPSRRRRGARDGLQGTC